jgi:hypothetical protein
VLLTDTNVASKAAPRFCVAIDLHQGWVSTMAIPNLQCEDAIVFIEYDEVQHIRCPHCWDLSHSELNCPTL